MSKKIKFGQEKTTDPQTIEKYLDDIFNEPDIHLQKSSFILITSLYPEASHITFEFPGKHLKKVNSRIYLPSGEELDIDYASTVLPDGNKVAKKSTIDVEFQSQLPSDEKIEEMFFNNIGLTYRKKIPSIPVIITNKNPGKSIIDYKIHNQLLRINYIIVTSEKISKRLDILKEICETRREFSESELLNFAYIAIFVEDNAKNIMEQLTVLFCRFPYIEENIKVNLHHVFKNMIRHHFKDDLKKARELMRFIFENLSHFKFKHKNSYEKEIFEKDQKIKKLYKKLNELDNKLNEK